MCLSDVFFILVVYVSMECGQKKLNLVLKKKEGGGEEKRTKSSEKNLCIKHRDSFLKNKFAVLSDFAEGQNLSGRF